MSFIAKPLITFAKFSPQIELNSLKYEVRVTNLRAIFSPTLNSSQGLVRAHPSVLSRGIKIKIIIPLRRV